MGLSVRRLSLYILRPARSSTLFPYTTLFRSNLGQVWSTPSNADYRFDIAYEELSGRALLVYGISKRSEEHSELQSHSDLVCRLLLEKKKEPTRPDMSIEAAS